MIFKRYEKVKIPAQYGTIERATELDDGSVHIEKEKVLLRQEGEEYRNISAIMKYETRSERVTVPERKLRRKDGTFQIFPSSYKTVTKQVITGIDAQPPLSAVKTIKFLVKRDIRKTVLHELHSDYSEEQVLSFGLLGADIWYWKEVILLVLTNVVRSDLGKALGKVIPKG